MTVTLAACVGLSVLTIGCAPPIQETKHCDYVEVGEADQEVLSRYEYSHSEVSNIVLGTWTASFPGSDLVGAFTATVTVQRSQEMGATTLYGVADGPEGEVDDALFEECACVAVPIDVEIDADAPELNFKRSTLTVEGTSLCQSMDSAPLDALPAGVAQVEHNCDLPSGEEVKVSFAFMPDETLWISAESSGYRYQQSGARQAQ